MFSNSVVINPNAEEEADILQEFLLKKGFHWVHFEKAQKQRFWASRASCLRINFVKGQLNRGTVTFYTAHHMNILSVDTFMTYYGSKL